MRSVDDQEDGASGVVRCWGAGGESLLLTCIYVALGAGLGARARAR